MPPNTSLQGGHTAKSMHEGDCLKVKLRYQWQAVLVVRLKGTGYYSLRHRRNYTSGARFSKDPETFWA